MYPIGSMGRKSLSLQLEHFSFILYSLTEYVLDDKAMMSVAMKDYLRIGLRN